MKRPAKPVALALAGRQFVTYDQRESVREDYKRASLRSRRATVMAFHQYGLNRDKMADLLGVSQQEIDDRYAEALREMEAELDTMPEGPMFMSKVVIEAYANMTAVIMSVAGRASESLLRRLEDDTATHKDHTALQGWMRIMIESRDALTDRMERYGALPLVPKNLMGQPSRTLNPEDEQPFESHLRAVAKKHGIDFEEAKAKIIEESVG